jgi:hypothetical protein
VSVRERKRRQKGEGFPATAALTATDWDPVVVRIVRLLAASSVTGDRIALTNGTSSQDDVGAVFGPIRIELVRWSRKWDKKNRGSAGLCSGVDLPKIGAGSGAPPPEEKFQLEENNASRLQPFRGEIPTIRRLTAESTRSTMDWKVALKLICLFVVILVTGP